MKELLNVNISYLKSEIDRLRIVTSMMAHTIDEIQHNIDEDVPKENNRRVEETRVCIQTLIEKLTNYNSTLEAKYGTI